MPATTIRRENGFWHCRIDSFDEFTGFANYFSDDLGFVFRGQAQSNWLLETSLDRLIRQIDPLQVDLDSTYDFQLKQFVKAIRGRSAVAKDVASNFNELWAIGQHYGLATPLLDWTESLYVALFFAFLDANPSPSGHRTVWALHRDMFEAAMALHNEGRAYNQRYEFIDPLTDHNARLVSQAGVFTRQPLAFNVIEWAESKFSGSTNSLLFKIDVSDSERLRVMRHCRQMNISSGSLFPDLVGASLLCNETLELLADKRRRVLARDGR